MPLHSKTAVTTELDLEFACPEQLEFTFFFKDAEFSS
jgi:hypothetical protein